MSEVSCRTTQPLVRSQIMVHASATEIEYYATEQWAGDLGELVEYVLQANGSAVEPVFGRTGPEDPSPDLETAVGFLPVSVV